jgi:beta-galactosidase
MTAFPSHEGNAFGGLALVIVKAEKGVAGTIRLTGKATGLDPVSINITSK